MCIFFNSVRCEKNSIATFNILPYDKILAKSKLKAFAEDDFKVRPV